jgi:N-acetyl-alpha-D-muramate 1-phosphate uridylyltransferase
VNAGASAGAGIGASAGGRAGPRAAMILAAGRGERMRPLTDATPKPLLEIHGRPLIEWHVIALVDAGFERVVVNLAWLGAQIRSFLGDGRRYGVDIEYSAEEPRALEAGGGIFRALPLLGPGPFAVVNGDIFTDYPFARLELAAGADAHLVLVPNPPQHAHGDFGLTDGWAVPAAAEQFTYSGIAMYRSGFFDGCSDGVFALKPLLLRAMVAGRCSAELFGGVWEDVGTPQRLEALNASTPP